MGADVVEMKNNERPKGLVICDKTDRGEFRHDNFPSREELEAAAANFKEFEPESRAIARHFVSLSPGSVKVSKTSLVSTEKSPNYQARKPIVEWSKKSRSNMVAVFCSLDYSPMFESGRLPCLLTLTYPANFRDLCSSSKVGTRHLKLFRQRYERAYGTIRAIYKWEFMRSGSPHIHLFLVPPNDPGFRIWVSKTWAEIVGETDPIEYAKHLKAGTGVDYATGLRSSDPKRLTTYFSKHSSPNGDGDKEYQNQPPDFWKEEGSVGRFWGRWGLYPAVETVEVTSTEALFVARVLRRWSRANSKPKRVTVWRVTEKTGELRKRKVTRRAKRMKKREGFCSVNDGSQMGKQLARALEARFGTAKE